MHLKKPHKKGHLPLKLKQALQKFYESYSEALLQNGHALAEYEEILIQFLDRVVEHIANPYPFEAYHQRIRTPFDYYALGLNLMRPLVDFEKSIVLGKEHLNNVQKQLAASENVVLFANHQTEPDPQAISLLLEHTHPKMAEEMIFVAGHRVITDPLAVPFSIGRNLLCIYSKKYIQYPPEKKEEKQQHNQHTMKRMAQLLSEGGKCIYVAPSGGRDRPNALGQIEVAHFDPQSIEMFWLMSEKAEHPTHFYPLALSTYHLLPPPISADKEIGEKRQAQCTPIHLALGAEIDMRHFPGSDHKDRRQKRTIRADYIWAQVCKDYDSLNKISLSS